MTHVHLHSRIDALGVAMYQGSRELEEFWSYPAAVAFLTDQVRGHRTEVEALGRSAEVAVTHGTTADGRRHLTFGVEHNGLTTYCGAVECHVPKAH